MHRSFAEPATASALAARTQALTDDEVVARMLSGEVALFEVLMRRYNQRLFRTVRAMVPHDSEAEDIVQDAYVRAYQHLGRFEGRAKFSTWLTRIAIHEVLARQKKSRRVTSLNELERQPMTVELQDTAPTPEERASSTELRGVLERALERMPETLRVVFVLREVEGLDSAETAECLGISAANVKVRLHRARALLQSDIDGQLGAEVRRLHAFAGERCDRIVAGVLGRIGP